LGDLGMAQGMMIQDVLSQPDNTSNSADKALMQDEVRAMKTPVRCLYEPGNVCGIVPGTVPES
jgi:hypothetical protein